MTATTRPPSVVIDPLLSAYDALRELVADVDITDSLCALPTCDIAVLAPSTARLALANMPTSVEVIVAADRPDDRRLLDLYDAGAAIVTVGAPAEELAARVRAIVRRLRPPSLQPDEMERPDGDEEARGRRVRRAAAARAAARAGGVISLAFVLLGSAHAASVQPDPSPVGVVSQS
jgi:hypothetical protein